MHPLYNGPRATVYALVDPQTRAVRYVGVTMVALSMRLAGHLAWHRGWDRVRWWEALPASRWRPINVRVARNVFARHEWFDELQAQGLQPAIVGLGVYPLEIAADAERAWYRYYRARGAELLNGEEPTPGRLSSRLAVNTLDAWKRTRTGPRLHHVIVLGDRIRQFCGVCGCAPCQCCSN